jgi:short-subunit dehydrogenase
MGSAQLAVMTGASSGIGLELAPLAAGNRLIATSFRDR